MRLKTLLVFLLCPCMYAWSQNPATIFTIPNRNVNLPCGITCTSITATVPHIKQTTDYVVTTTTYLPFSYTGGTEVSSVYIDDKFSASIGMGFPFCFYGNTYSNTVIGSNAILTFDLSNATLANSFPLDIASIGQPIPYAGGTQDNIFSTYYPKASIMGVYHDILPSNTNGGARRIEYRVEGTAPRRRFIVSYKDVPLFDCETSIHNSQMVLYESTGIIEVYVKDKPVCTDWNEGLAILGIQNFDRNKAVAAPGKNATVWGTAGMNEAYRFTPSGGTSAFKKAELLVNNVVVAMADTSSGAPGDLTLNFPTVCPGQDSTAYVLRVTYGQCNDAANDVVYDDTVFVKRPTPTITLSTQNASCATGGSITVNGGGAGFQYSLNGGTSQASNVFSNLQAGIYTVSALAGAGCASSSQATITLVNNLTVNALPSDTSLCSGATFTPRVTSNAASFSWTPTSAVQGSNVTLQPQLITGNQNLQYILTATQGPCIIKDTIRVTVFPGPTVSAGPDQTIISGDVIQLQANAAPGTYVWSPTTGLSASNILRPNASPTQTITYTLTATSGQGCVSTDNVTITVLDCIDPMDAFTPNGDGVNDRWLINNNGCYKTARVDVFNRYGAKVFEDASYSNQWDGTYKGKPVPDGTYYYIVTYQLVNGKTQYLRGNVTILR